MIASPEFPAAEKPPTKGERTRQQLLEVAAAEFAERGFQNARISDIVARAGVTQPVFYQYFASKQAAYDELVELFTQRLRQAIACARLPDDTPQAGVAGRVAQGVAGLLDILQHDMNLTRIGFFQVERADALKGELEGMIAGNVRAEQAAGLFRDDVSPEWFAQALMGAIERFTRKTLDAEERRRCAAFIADLFLEGMRRR